MPARHVCVYVQRWLDNPACITVCVGIPLPFTQPRTAVQQQQQQQHQYAGACRSMAAHACTHASFHVCTRAYTYVLDAPTCTATAAHALLAALWIVLLDPPD